jgi:hypothetical protein
METVEAASNFYIGNLNTISTLLAVFFLLYSVSAKMLNGGVKKLSEDFLRDELPKLLAVFTLPVVPALLICAVSPELLSKLGSGVSLPILVAAAALIWALSQPFNKP